MMCLSVLSDCYVSKIILSVKQFILKTFAYCVWDCLRELVCDFFSLKFFEKTIDLVFDLKNYDLGIVNNQVLVSLRKYIYIYSLKIFYLKIFLSFWPACLLSFCKLGKETQWKWSSSLTFPKAVRLRKDCSAIFRLPGLGRGRLG